MPLVLEDWLLGTYIPFNGHSVCEYDTGRGGDKPNGQVHEDVKGGPAVCSWVVSSSYSIDSEQHQRQEISHRQGHEIRVTGLEEKTRN